MEVADVFRQHGKEFLDRWGDLLSRQQLKAFRDLSACRTAALGTCVQQCDHCSHQVVEYRSCRNRHCPKCHSRARDQWLAARAEELLPVPYAHVVFTLPHEMAPLTLQNPGVVYGILFRAAAEALLEMAADPKRLGARIGFLAVLHTWSQRLEAHPHIHCVVPAGGYRPTGSAGSLPGRKTSFYQSNHSAGCSDENFWNTSQQLFWRVISASTDPFANSLTRSVFKLGSSH